MNHIVIMAGGVGSRFWPMSRPECPKQFIDVIGIGKSLIQLTVERFGNLIEPENIWVVTSAAYAGLVAEQLPSVPKSNILLEPCMRNTAPCIAYVAWKIAKKDPEATMVVTPADHFVMDTAEFQRIIAKGLKSVKGTSNVLTLGMKPTRPDTGYGYIQAAGATADNEILNVNAFREKPQLEVAKQYLAEGNYFWNGGLFLWDVQTAKAAIAKFEPGIASIMNSLEPSLLTGNEQQEVNRLFPECNNISIDFAVMERMAGKQEKLLGKEADVLVFPSNFGWSDLGTWGSLYTQLEHDSCENALVGKEHIRLIESNGCIVRSSGNLRMVLQGLNDFIVAEDNGTLLVCKRSDEQRIKEFSKLF